MSLQGRKEPSGSFLIATASLTTTTVMLFYEERAQQSFDHARLRLSAVAKDAVSRDPTIGMMWAKFEGIDMRTNDSKLTQHPFVQIANMPRYPAAIDGSFMVGDKQSDLIAAEASGIAAYLFDTFNLHAFIAPIVESAILRLPSQ